MSDVAQLWVEIKRLREFIHERAGDAAARELDLMNRVEILELAVNRLIRQADGYEHLKKYIKVGGPDAT